MTVNDVPELRQTFGRFAIDTADVTYSAGGAAHIQRKGELIITGPGLR